jgi:glycosyltransferase involved in cell wall biosynthesis
MKVALTYPYCWPEVRRGGERLFHDLAGYLISSGVDVVSVSAQGVTAGPAEQPGELHLGRALPDRRLPGGVVLDRPISYLPGAARAIRKARPDVVHGLFHLDGVAARLARAGGRRVPNIVHVQGMPRRANLDRLPLHRLLFWPSVRGASLVLAVSRAAAEALEEEFGVKAQAFHNGVFTETYRRTGFGERAAEPTVFFPADPSDPRKRLELLGEAMGRLEAPWRTSRLVVAGEAPPELIKRLTEKLGDRVYFAGVLTVGAMVSAYASTWITCLPAVREAFGLVIVESLASGRPCVAVRDGGVPEILTKEAWLAGPDDADSLAESIGCALADSEDPNTVGVCRHMAEPFGWNVRGPELVEIYRRLLPD